MLWETLNHCDVPSNETDNDVQGKNMLLELLGRKGLSESRRLRTPPSTTHRLKLYIVYTKHYSGTWIFHVSSFHDGWATDRPPSSEGF